MLAPHNAIRPRRAAARDKRHVNWTKVQQLPFLEFIALRAIDVNTFRRYRDSILIHLVDHDMEHKLLDTAQYDSHVLQRSAKFP